MPVRSFARSPAACSFELFCISWIKSSSTSDGAWQLALGCTSTKAVQVDSATPLGNAVTAVFEWIRSRVSQGYQDPNCSLTLRRTVFFDHSFAFSAQLSVEFETLTSKVSRRNAASLSSCESASPSSIFFKASCIVEVFVDCWIILHAADHITS